MTVAVISRQASWHIYFLLADTELKFGCPEEALIHLSDAKSKIKQATDEQENIFDVFEAKALSTTNAQDKLERSVQLCEKVCI